MTTDIESPAYSYMMRKIRPYVVSGRGNGPEVFKAVELAMRRGDAHAAELRQVLDDLEIEIKVMADPLAFNRLNLVERLLTLL
jgi:hypothetical protein